MSEKRELNLKELDFVSGGKRVYGNWYVVHFKDGSTGQRYTYEDAVEYSKQHGGGYIETKWGVLGRKGQEIQRRAKNR